MLLHNEKLYHYHCFSTSISNHLPSSNANICTIIMHSILILPSEKTFLNNGNTTRRKYCVIKIGEKLDCGEQMEIRHDLFLLHLLGLKEAIDLKEQLTIPMYSQYLIAVLQLVRNYLNQSLTSHPYSIIHYQFQSRFGLIQLQSKKHIESEEILRQRHFIYYLRTLLLTFPFQFGISAIQIIHDK